MAVLLKIISRKASLFYCMIFLCSTITAQNCPSNIDFESGTFNNWQCLAGHVQASGNQNIISISPTGGPIADQHTMFSRVTSSGIMDPFGNFPVVCPNGSGYSIKLGNTTGGHEAEGVEYRFTIPANRNTFSLVYYYAVVFENPNHQIHQQPRMEIEVKNVTDNTTIDCSTFTFIPFGSPLPGFFVSPLSSSVFCKDWTPVTINLNGKAGKQISLTFRTADCTFNRHFGYAYVDVNTDCSGEFTGAAFCHDDTAVNVVGPYGFEGYKWYDASFSNLLGTGQTLVLQPPPPSGTVLKLEVTPYNGYGCVDTMTATLVDTLTLQANAGPDVVMCGTDPPVVLGEQPRAGVVYEWSPSTGLDDSTISNPFANPPVTTAYRLNIRSTGGGCRSSDNVIVTKSNSDSSLTLLGKNEFCITSKDSAVLLINPPANSSIQWFKDNSTIVNATAASYRIRESGNYFAQIINFDGCRIRTRTEKINIEIPASGIRYPVLFTLKDQPLDLKARDFKGTVQWVPGQYLNNVNVINPVFVSPIETEIQYQVNIVSKAGCATTDYQPVKVIKEVKVYVPSAFTPNNDGLNDFIYPISIGATIEIFKIYNRWGQEVFSMEQNERGWDGTFKGVPQATDSYVWYMRGAGVDKKLYQRRGSVTLIR